MDILPKNANPKGSDLTQGSPIAIGWRGATRRKKLPDHTKFCILSPMVDSKPVEFRGSALDDLRAFPQAARREAGYQLDRIQHGREPDDWKPMNTVGRGVREIRIRDAVGAFRVLYVAKFDDAVYVLHCFQKKTQKTSKADLNLASQRYRDLLKELDQ
jgi:phage-related protein